MTTTGVTAFGGGAGGPSESDCFPVAFSLTGVSAVLPFVRCLIVRLIGSTITVRVLRRDFLALMDPSGLRVAVCSEEPGVIGETGTCSVDGRLIESVFPFVIVSFDDVRELLFWEGVRWMPLVDCSSELLKSLEIPILSIDRPFLCRLCFDDVVSVFSDEVGVLSEGGVEGGPVTSMETGGAAALCAETIRWVIVSERSRDTVAGGVLGRAFAELLLVVSSDGLLCERSRSGLDVPKAAEPFATRPPFC